MPSRLGAKTVLTFLSDSALPTGTTKCVWDFRPVGHFSPFAMLVLASGLNAVKRQHPEVNFFVMGVDGQSYAQHMGFFRAIHVKKGNKPGEASGSYRYHGLPPI